jgi:hypothetical protein
LSNILFTRESFSNKTKLFIALALFTISYVTKSLHAVDLAPLMYTAQQPFGGLTVTYDQRAQSILEGKGLLGPYDINPNRTVWLAQAPGYSIFLSMVYRIVERDFFEVQIVQNCLNSLSPILLFLIAGRLLSWRVGIVAGLIAALSHHLSYISNYILPDSLAALPLLASVYLMTHARGSKHGPAWLWACAGAFIGLAVLLRSQLLLGAPFLALVYLLCSTRRTAVAMKAGLLVITALLVVTPVTVKNYLVYGSFVPVNIGMGIVLWEGIAEESGDRFGAVATDEAVALQEAELYGNPHYAGSWSTPDGIERDRARIRKSLSIIGSHPFWYAGVMLKRMRNMVRYSADAPIVYTIDQVRRLEVTLPRKPEWRLFGDEHPNLGGGSVLYLTRPLIRPLQRLAKETMLGSIMLGLLLGVFLAPRRGALLIAIPVYYFLFQSFMHTEFRYTLPMQYFLFAFGALAWVAVGSLAWRSIGQLRRLSQSR